MGSNDYADALIGLGVPELIEELIQTRESLTEDRILNTIFYSSSIEGNKLDMDAARLLINNKFAELQGRLTDYLELLNHKFVYEYILNFDDKSNFTRKEAIELHRLLFSGLISGYPFLRRGAATVDLFLTETAASEVGHALDDVMKLLNLNGDSKLDAFLKAVDFHASYVHLHPFEDGNGRTVRLLANYFLVRNGMPMFTITEELKP